MDCHLQALKSQVLREIIPMLQSQKQDLRQEIERIDRDRKRDQKAINLEINLLKQKLQGRENSSMGNAVKFLDKQYREQIQAINILAENVTFLSSKMQIKETINPTTDKISKQQEYTSKFIESNKEKLIVSPMSKNLDKFKIECNERIIRVALDHKHYQLMGNIPIVQKAINKFKLQKVNYGITIGIIDQKYVDDQNSVEQKRSRCIMCKFYDSFNDFYYLSSEAQFHLNQVKKPTTQNNFPLPNSQASKLSGIIKMKVEGNTVYWYHNQEIKAMLTTPIIQESAMNWVPFIIMQSQGDKIDWF